MSFEYWADPARPAWAGLLPGRPETYFLSKGEGEHAKLYTVDLSRRSTDPSCCRARRADGLASA
jgi:hypothetical protein